MARYRAPLFWYSLNAFRRLAHSFVGPPRSYSLAYYEPVNRSTKNRLYFNRPADCDRPLFSCHLCRSTTAFLVV